MTTILTPEQIAHKIRRIAYQIYEANIHQEKIILAGIESNGYIFAEKLHQELSQICPIPVVLCRVKVNKTNVLAPVLSSGAPLLYGVKHFLEVPLKQLKTAVLVNRNHKKFPIKADFKGLSLSTSLQEHIEVSFEGEPHAYLQ